MRKESLYTVKQVSDMAGVSVRTLHLYDELGLLKPCIRTEAKYRMYGKEELLKLQQILFYRELDIPLQEISRIMSAPSYDLIKSLEEHRKLLVLKGKQISTILLTIDKTIEHLKGGFMLSHEDLYEGFPGEKREAYRNDAIEKYGKDAVLRSESHLMKLSKAELASLSHEQVDIREKLRLLMNQAASSVEVQEQIARHYHIIRMFWGTSDSIDKQGEQYAGLGQLYVHDERYMTVDGQAQPELAAFMCKAMTFFAETTLI